jgi:hypothetical protein
MLASVVTRAGLDVVRVGYTERLGVLPYWLSYRLMNRSGVSGQSIKLFDRVYVPLMAAVERCAGSLPMGKNVVCLAAPPPSAAPGPAAEPRLP